MCLNYSRKATAQVNRMIKEAKKKDKDYLTFYKVVYKGTYDNGLQYFYSIYQGYIYRPGQHYSNGDKPQKLVDNKRISTAISKGFHLYRNRKRAIKECRKGYERYVLTFRCPIKDFIAAGNNVDVVFKSIELTQAQFDKAKSY